MRIGAHQSISGGLERAIHAARRDGCESLQIFTRNQAQWKMPPLGEERIARFRTALADWGIPPERVLVHDSYLINVAARDRSLRRKSARALGDELRRCAALGLPHLVMHPGAHVGQGEVRGLELVAAGVREALERSADDAPQVRLLFENTAGQGTNLGYSFEHLRDLLGTIDAPERLGICIDTQHLFAAGYDASTAEGYASTFALLDRVVGLEWVRGFHLNDSKRELGCRVDRHERIGHGYIGRTCFRLLVNDARFADHPGVLELPPPYPPQLTRLRRMSDGTATRRRRPRPGAAGPGL